MIDDRNPVPDHIAIRKLDRWNATSPTGFRQNRIKKVLRGMGLFPVGNARLDQVAACSAGPEGKRPSIQFDRFHQMSLCVM